MIRMFFWVLLSALLSGCMTFPRPQMSDYIGACKRLSQPAYIYKGRASLYRGEYILGMAPNINYEKDIVAGELGVGQKFYIRQIVKAGDGSWGDFLRIEVELLGGPFSGYTVDVPSCVPFHFGYSWTENCTIDANALTFNESIVVDCDQE